MRKARFGTRFPRLASRRCNALVFLGLFLFQPVAAEAQRTVARVIDGDTFELSDGTRVRLIGIDTPEKYPSRKLDQDAARTGQDRAAIQALGQLASEFAEQLVDGKPVELEYDQANAATNHRDRYGRVLAYVWLVEEGERAVFVNRRMVSAGYANAYTSYPFRYAEEFRAAEREARREGRGLWGDGLSPRTTGGTAAPTRTAPRATPGGDRDCGDFDSQGAAQRFFATAGRGDPHRLDGDDDGIACESLP